VKNPWATRAKKEGQELDEGVPRAPDLGDLGEN